MKLKELKLSEALARLGYEHEKGKHYRHRIYRSGEHRPGSLIGHLDCFEAWDYLEANHDLNEEVSDAVAR